MDRSRDVTNKVKDIPFRGASKTIPPEITEISECLTILRRSKFSFYWTNGKRLGHSMFGHSRWGSRFYPQQIPETCSKCIALRLGRTSVRDNCRKETPLKVQEIRLEEILDGASQNL